eukprot:sb/3473099/
MPRLILFLIPVLLPILSAKEINLLVLKHLDSPHTNTYDLTLTITNLPEHATILDAMVTAQNAGNLSFTTTQDKAHGALVTEIDGVGANWAGKHQYWELWVEEEKGGGPKWEVEGRELVRVTKGASSYRSNIPPYNSSNVLIEQFYDRENFQTYLNI